MSRHGCNQHIYLSWQKTPRPPAHLQIVPNLGKQPSLDLSIHPELFELGQAAAAARLPGLDEQSLVHLSCESSSYKGLVHGPLEKINTVYCNLVVLHCYITVLKYMLMPCLNELNNSHRLTSEGC